MPPAEVCYLTTAGFPERESAKFWTTPAVLMAIFGGRLGSRGFTIMYSKESSEMTTLEDKSTNANFSSNFSPSASLTPVSINIHGNSVYLSAGHIEEDDVIMIELAAPFG
ncbi:Serine/threonine-protein kinase Nek2 [Phytophthora cinnamomi]|uniref:Serine/threonine-protein kinase Nek2 n=1 Tax=Phytophthora cinnamomi TaxID=4785 RepID=UPI00355ABFA4|nr:Serine/threonine-protein kinase Nek2 [Phytophthora cinnamomi]